MTGFFPLKSVNPEVTTRQELKAEAVQHSSLAQPTARGQSLLRFVSSPVPTARNTP